MIRRVQMIHTALISFNESALRPTKIDAIQMIRRVRLVD
jgi:hypothetical protein